MEKLNSSHFIGQNGKLLIPQCLHCPYKHFFACHSSSSFFGQSIICHKVVMLGYKIEDASQEFVGPQTSK